MDEAGAGSVKHSLVPEVPPSLPRFGNAFTRLIGRSILRIMGWRIVGPIPDESKMMLAVAPHTSNWDFFIGIAAVFAMGVRGTWLGKHTIFRKPFGGYMRWLGGIPVDRTKPGGVVGQVAETIRQADRMVLGLSPEGTRSRVSRWKTGFLRIAEAGGIPIYPVSFDYRLKEIRFGERFVPSGDLEGDLARFRQLFDGVTARKPDQFEG